MPCFTRRIVDDQLVVNAHLSPSVLSPQSSAVDGPLRTQSPVSALIDTGATGCGISAQLAHSIAAVPVSQADVLTANGVARVNLFLIDIHVLMEEDDAVVEFSEVSATEFPDDGSDATPLILGMDLIRAGSLHVSGHVFTFAL